MVHANAMDAFELLLEVEQRTRQFAAKLPRPSQADVVWTGIGFSLGDSYFVTPLSELVEILAVPEITYLPCMQTWVMGVANVRGESLPIVNLSRYLQFSATGTETRSRILVVDHGGIRCGLWVSQVLGLEHFYRHHKLLNSGCTNPIYASYWRGSWQSSSIIWSILSLHALVADAVFQPVKK
jgi:twitching motility protein PilI